jgi:hypothetical protein
MSRVTLYTDDGGEVAVGVDPVLGWFVQVFEYWEDDPIIDIDSYGPAKASRGQIIDVIKKHAKENEMKQAVIDSVVLDIDPAHNWKVQRIQRLMEILHETNEAVARAISDTDDDCPF